MSKENHKPVYFITGGGTGGHIYPAVAVADSLDGQIYYVGNPQNLEFNIVSGKGYDFLPIKISGMPRKAGIELIKWGIQLIFAIVKCMGYIAKYKPDVVFGTGGYVSAPSLIAAKILNVPFVMHDCDANPGLVTRKLSPYASGVSLAFDCAQKFIHNQNCHINGNPIRKAFQTMSKEDARTKLRLENKMTICIVGGSQGAKSINDSAVEILETISSKHNIQVIFQTGQKKFDDVQTKLEKIYPEYKNDKNLIVQPYFEDMVTVLKASDIAVSRAGSLSISEICASGVAPIFVPYPHAAADHQRKNARLMEESGAGIYLEDSEISPQILLEQIENLINNPELLNKIQTASIALAKYNGTEKIIELIKTFVK